MTTRAGVGAATGSLGRIALRSSDDETATTLIDDAIAIVTELGADTWAAELWAHRIAADLFAGRWQAVLDAVPGDPEQGGAGQDGALRSKLLRSGPSHSPRPGAPTRRQRWSGRSRSPSRRSGPWG